MVREQKKKKTKLKKPNQSNNNNKTSIKKSINHSLKRSHTSMENPQKYV